MILSISWRNIWRNRLRSIVILSAIAFGLFAGVYSAAFMMGWLNQRVNNIIETEVSHIQVHQKGYLETMDVKDYLTNIEEVETKVQSHPSVDATATRVIVNAMISSAETGSGVQLLGVNPEEEKKVTDLYTKVIKGKYFEGIKRNPILIGQQLAEKLKVRKHSKVVVTLTQMDGTLTGGSFRVVGIFRTANTSYDEMKAFVRAEDLRNLINLEQSAGHEIAVSLKKNNIENKVAQELSAKFPGLDIMTWLELMPDMQMMNESMGFFMYIFVAIILLALGFGIVNTMLMVVLERVKELGMLMAIGMNKVRVFTMIVLETVLLCLTGGVAGIFIAVIVTVITGYTGLNLSMWSEGLNAYGFDSMVYPEITFESVLIITVLVVVIGVIAALIPARKAIKLNPAEALRTDN
jgi:putative ABC transport system permease protein